MNGGRQGIGSQDKSEREAPDTQDVDPIESELTEPLTVKEVARRLGVNRKTLYNEIRRGVVPGVCALGRALRVHWPTVLEWWRQGQGPVSRSGRRVR